MLKGFKSAFSTWNTTRAVHQAEYVKQALKTEANNLGFVLFGCSRPKVAVDFARYVDWLERGFGEGMPYLARQQALSARQDPSILLPGARTVISLAVPYALVSPAMSDPKDQSQGHIASYAIYGDYHEVLFSLVGKLAEQLKTLAPEAQFRVCVDTAPILEKAFAYQAGLGWIGQNTLLFNAKYGSGLLLAEILTTVELPADQPLAGDPCIGCKLCVDACPTGALMGNRTMDSRRCISFLTIENHAEVPVPYRHPMGNHVFGCDECQQACPYNIAAFPSKTQSPLSARVVPSVDLHTELSLDDQTFKAKYAGTPVLRAKHAGFLRNLIIAAGNSGDLSLLPQLQILKSECAEPMLQEALGWAISALEIPSSAS